MVAASFTASSSTTGACGSLGLFSSVLRRVSSGRFDLHELVKQYAAEKLATDPQGLEETQARHGQYYAEWLREQWNHPCIAIWDACNETRDPKTGDAFMRIRKLDLSGFLDPRPQGGASSPVPFNQEGVAPLNQQILADAEPFLEDGGIHHHAYAISTGDRGTLATLAGVIARGVRERRLRGEDPAVPGKLHLDFTGSAGQGFGAFLTEGLEVRLQGEANDSVCKSMSGGRAILVPHPEASYTAETNAIVGNGALYGATGGTLLVLGLAGDRFAVRNSGASAVVEGAGHHACEYMTRGAVAILGPVLTNAGAGMTGGCLFLRRERAEQVNRDYLATIPWRPEEEALFRGLLEAHADETGSHTARALLEDWPATLAAFAPFVPVAVARQLGQVDEA